MYIFVYTVLSNTKDKDMSAAPKEPLQKIAVSTQVHRDAKVEAAKRGVTIKDFTEEALREKLATVQTLIYPQPEPRTTVLQESGS